jgi:serine/threonine-protein kinase
MPKAKEAARKALEIDDSIAESHVHMGNVYTMYELDWPAAEREFARAIELDQNNADAHEYHAWLLMAVGDTRKALEEAHRAVELDPVFPENSALTACILCDDTTTQLLNAGSA